MTFDVPALNGSGCLSISFVVLPWLLCHLPSWFDSLMRLSGIVVSILMRVVGAEALSSRFRLRNDVRTSSLILFFGIASLMGLIGFGGGVIVLRLVICSGGLGD